MLPSGTASGGWKLARRVWQSWLPLRTVPRHSTPAVGSSTRSSGPCPSGRRNILRMGRFGRMASRSRPRFPVPEAPNLGSVHLDRKSTRLNSSHSQISYAVFCLKKKKQKYYRHVTHTIAVLILPTPHLYFQFSHVG